MHLLSENILHILHSLYLQQKICAAAKIRNFPQLLFLLLRLMSPILKYNMSQVHIFQISITHRNR